MSHFKKKTIAGLIPALLVSVVAYATHEPPGSEPINYDGPLSPSVTASGAVGHSSPNDGYDWYCFNAVNGVQISVNANRTSGDILPNIGLKQGEADEGDANSVLTELAHTSNSGSSSTTLNYTPNFSGPVTIWVSTWFFENGGNYDVTMTGGTAQSACGILALDVDIKPGSDENPINTKSKGVVPVAILGSASFDVTTIDVATLTFGPGGASPAHDGHLEYVNDDAYLDLVTHYPQQDTGIAPGDTEACVTGQDIYGEDLEGCDTIHVIN